MYIEIPILMWFRIIIQVVEAEAPAQVAYYMLLHLGMLSILYTINVCEFVCYVLTIQLIVIKFNNFFKV